MAAFAFSQLTLSAQTTAVIHAEPLHAGRVDPMLFGNFIELLDDLVPGMGRNAE